MTARSGVRNRNADRAALGVRCHSGWAAFVVLGSSVAAPQILERGRMELCNASIKGSKQPFHEAEPMKFAAAERYISTCKAATGSLAKTALRTLVARHGMLRACCVLTASGRPLPGLSEILASHALIHAAEGEFYREAIVGAAECAGIPVFKMRERDVEAAADRLPGSEDDRRARLADFGKQVGSPWRQDEKLAAIGAWLALAGKPSQPKVSTLGG
jgi:hypothetical protein